MINFNYYKSKFYPLILVVILICLLLFLPKTTNRFRGRVRSVIDGDTIELYDGRIVRYIGVDVPRIKLQQKGKWIFSPQPFSVEARDFNEKVVSDKKIRLKFDVKEKDRYGRILAYCFLKIDGQEVFINQKILEEGLGYLAVGAPNVKYIDTFVQAQKLAQKQQKGLWKDLKSISPKRARNYIGRRKLIEGKIIDVAETRRSVVLKFHRKKKSYLKIVIFKYYLDNFKKLNIEPRTFYLGKKIKTFGLINEYSGPEIFIFHPLQIEIID